MSKTWYPVIDYEVCEECGACYNKCKHGVDKKEGNRPVVVFTEGCVEYNAISLCSIIVYKCLC